MAKKTSRKASTAPRMTKHERAGISYASRLMHANSAAISSRIRILECESEETDIAISALTASLADWKDKRARLDAQIKSLNLVLAKRTL